ncbi:MAG: hypothetical protein EA425_07790 [Puniceicoccaceae bacterium]|nr:MAG: hypothetical protein EA425_07790 [Puniceicoccaceae bacterium]
METWIWHGLRLQLPADWELLEFSKNPRQGRLLFADADDIRLEASWQEAAGEPGWRRLLSDYRHMLEEAGWDTAKPRRHGPWHLLPTEGGDRIAWRAFRHFPGSRRLLELVVRPPPEQTLDAVTSLLDGCDWPQPPEDSLHWRAFGIEVRFSSHHRLKDCDIKPAHVKLEFEHERHRLVCERRGLADLWLRGDLEEWIESKLPEGTRVLKREARFDEAGPGFDFNGVHHRGRGMLGWLRRRPFTGRLWRCSRCGRILRWLAYPLDADNEEETPLVLGVACTDPEGLN